MKQNSSVVYWAREIHITCFLKLGQASGTLLKHELFDHMEHQAHKPMAVDKLGYDLLLYRYLDSVSPQVIT